MYLTAALLHTAAVLIERRGLRRRLCAVRPFPFTGWCLQATIGTDANHEKPLCLAVDTSRSNRIAVLGLLEATSKRATRINPDGSAGRGVRELAHFGPSGGCELELSQRVLHEMFAGMFGAYLSETLERDPVRAQQLALAPARCWLHTPEDESIAFPDDEVLVRLAWALADRPQVLEASEQARFGEAIRSVHALSVRSLAGEFFVAKPGARLPVAA